MYACVCRSPGAPGPNANYDLALLRWGVRTAIHLAKQHSLPAPASDTSLWQRLTDKLIGPSLDEEGRFAIYEGTPYATAHRHFSHLLPLWPLRELSNLSDALEHRRAVGSVDLWSSMPELFSLFGRSLSLSLSLPLSLSLSLALSYSLILSHTLTRCSAGRHVLP